MEFGDQDVDEGGTVPEEIGKREDLAGDDADRVGEAGGDASLGDELGDDGFGKDVELVDEEGRGLGVGGIGWGWGGEEEGDVGLGVGD